MLKQTFKLIDKKIKFKLKKKEGSSIKKGDLIAIIEGNIKNILIGERVALNFIVSYFWYSYNNKSICKKSWKKMQNLLH